MMLRRAAHRYSRATAVRGGGGGASASHIRRSSSIYPVHQSVAIADRCGSSSFPRSFHNTAFSSSSAAPLHELSMESDDNDCVENNTSYDDEHQAESMVSSLTDVRGLHQEAHDRAEERRRLHQEKYDKAEKRRVLDRRKKLADGMMRIFASSDECFNIALRELDIDKTWGVDTGLTEYRNFYLDSLHSFGAMLSDYHEEDNDTLAQFGLDSESAINILEHFSEEKGDPQEYSQRYRKMTSMLKKQSEDQTKLDKLQEEKENLGQKLEVEEQLLELMESEQTRDQSAHLTNLGEKVASAKDILDATSGHGDNTSLVENSFFGELDQLEKELQGALAQVSKLSSKSNGSETKELIKQRNKVGNLQEQLAGIDKKINRIESALSEAQELPMSETDYQSVTQHIINVATYLAPSLAKFISLRQDDFDSYRKLEMQTDLTKPHEWYPHARLLKRKIIFHAGNTNSGKTYSALQRLKQANKGMYLAPLRLLAAEIYEDLNAEGVYTDLLTGQEKREVPFSTHQSSTVELANLDQDYDVVVIDEIQMIADTHRGFAWTRSLLGVRCREIHICGGLEAMDIVKKICNMCGDDFEMHQYERFSELQVLDKSLGDTPTTKGVYKHVQPGDCVVAFSRNDLFAIKREIEQSTAFKCCVVYGSLPPAIRAEQARRFNDPNSGYDILVATDAIGMGLNLSIKRIIFNSMHKSGGGKIVQLSHSAVKQIAGRAGRRNSQYPNGEVTCRDPNDMAHLRKCMNTDIKPIKQAGLVPTPGHITDFNQHLEEYGSSGKETQLHETLRKFGEMATMQGNFFMCRKQSMETVSKWLEDIDGMSPADKFALCMSPVNETCDRSRNTLLKYVETYSIGKTPGILFNMRPRPVSSFHHLSDLCTVHLQLELFMWLQGKFPSNEIEVLRAIQLKDDTIRMINTALSDDADKLALKHCYVSRDKRMKQLWSESGEAEG